MDANVLRTLQPVDLQQLARKYNIADNLTNETTIDLLLKAFSRGVGEGDNANISKIRDANTCTPLASQGPRGGAAGSTSSAFEDPNSSMVVERSSPEPGQGLPSSCGEPLYGSPADGDRGHGDQANGLSTNSLPTNGDPAAATRPGGAGRTADRDRGRRLARYRRKAEREEEARRDAARRARRLVHQARHDRAFSPVVHELDDATRINTVRLFRRVHNTIEHEYYALDDLQERAQAALQKSLSYTKSAMMARASTYRFGSWLSYYQPGPAKWPTKEIWGEDPRARTFRLQADGRMHEQDEQTGTLPFYSRKRGPDDVPTELPHTRDTPPLEKKLKRLGVLVTQERAEELFRDIRCRAPHPPPTKKRKIMREEEKGKAVDGGQVNAVDKGKGKAVDKGKGKAVRKEEGKAVESAPLAFDDAETREASGTDKNKKSKGNGRKKQAIDEQNVTIDPNLIVDPNAMLDPSAPPRSIAQSRNLRVRHNDIRQTLGHIMKWNLARMMHGEPPYAWAKIQPDKNGNFYSEAIGFLTYGGHIVPGPVPGGHGLVFSDNIVEPGRNDPISSSDAGLSKSASGVDQRKPDIGSAARSRDLPVVSSNVVFDRFGGTTPGAKQPSASASVDHAAPGVPPDQSAPDASLSEHGRSQPKRSSNDDDGEEEEEDDVLQLPPLGGYAYGPADPWHKWLMDCLLQQMSVYTQRPISPVAGAHPGPSTNSTVAAQQPRAVEHQGTPMLTRNDHPPHSANLAHTAHPARPREDVGLVAQLPLSPTPSSSRFNGTALSGSSEMTLQPSGSAPLRSNADARLANPAESSRGSVPRLKPVANTSANVSGSAVAFRGDAEQVPPAAPGATPEQHDDAMQVDVDETTDSDEPISGVAARIINVKGSYDLNGAAEARRYLDATRRASARDNTNSPVTPRTRAPATPDNPLVLRVLSSPLPPSDPIPEDTNSAPEDSGNRLSAVPSVLDTSARQKNLEREIFGTPEPGDAESTVYTEGTRAEGIRVNPVFPLIPEVDEDEDMTAEKSIESMLVPQSSPGADRLANVVEHSDDDTSRQTVVSPAAQATPPRRVTRSRSQLPSGPLPRRTAAKRTTPSSRRGKAAK